MQHVFKVLAVLALLLAPASAFAEIYWEHVGHDPCDPPGARTHKDTYAGYDGSKAGALLGWYILNCDGTESWVPNQARAHRGASDDGGGSYQSEPPVKPEVFRAFVQNLATMQKLAGGAEITVSTTNKVMPELGNVDRMTIRVPEGMLSPLAPFGESPMKMMGKRPHDLR